MLGLQSLLWIVIVPSRRLDNRVSLSRTSTETLAPAFLVSSDQWLADALFEVRLEATEDGYVDKYCKLPSTTSIGDPERLCEENASVEKLNRVYERVNELANSLNHSGSWNLMLQLIELGRELYELIFNRAEQAEIAANLERMQEDKLRSANPDKSYAPRVLIECRGVNIPWELLYMGDVPSPQEIVAQNLEEQGNWSDQKAVFDYQNFLGFNFFFTQRNSKGSNIRGTRVAFDKGIGITVFSDDLHSGKNAIGLEVSSIQSIASVSGVATREHPRFPGFRQKDGKNGPDGGIHFSAYVNENPASLFHFACHSEIGTQGKEIRVSSGYYISQYEIEKRLELLDFSPFIVFNSCELGVRDPKPFDDFMGLLFSKGFRGILATEIKLADDVALEFVKEIYTNWFDQTGGSLHAAIFWARRKLADKFGLVGFCYSFYGRDDLIFGA